MDILGELRLTVQGMAGSERAHVSAHEMCCVLQHNLHTREDVPQEVATHRRIIHPNVLWPLQPAGPKHFKMDVQGYQHWVL